MTGTKEAVRSEWDFKQAIIDLHNALCPDRNVGPEILKLDNLTDQAWDLLEAAENVPEPSAGRDEAYDRLYQALP
ncbi:MAG: hypothetical protein KAJ19_21695 [Gammaproteobacteria bacterium]|nr:hypothetical protein [Gammaproteobacteria bacterium]